MAYFPDDVQRVKDYSRSQLNSLVKLEHADRQRMLISGEWTVVWDILRPGVDTQYLTVLKDGKEVWSKDYDVPESERRRPLPKRLELVGLDQDVSVRVLGQGLGEAGLPPQVVPSPQGLALVEKHNRIVFLSQAAHTYDVHTAETVRLVAAVSGGANLSVHNVDVVALKLTLPASVSLDNTTGKLEVHHPNGEKQTLTGPFDNFAIARDHENGGWVRSGTCAKTTGRAPSNMRVVTPTVPSPSAIADGDAQLPLDLFGQG